MTKYPSKVCFKCGEEKPLDEFYAHPEMSDGHVNKCKECNKEDVQTNYRKNKNYYKRYDQERNKRPERTALKAKLTKEHRKNNELQYKAKSAVNNAVRDGRLTKPSRCSLCGVEKRLEGHHHDYNKPLDVVWVCSQCHTYIHKYIAQIS